MAIRMLYLEVQCSSKRSRSQQSLAMVRKGHMQVDGMSSMLLCHTKRLAENSSCLTLAPCFRSHAHAIVRIRFEDF